MKELRFIVTISQVNEDVREAPDFRNVRNKTVLVSLIRTRYTTIKRRIKMNNAYCNLPICSKEDFFGWAIKCQELVKLFKAWTESGHQTRLIPTVDRVDPKKGYVISNLRWIPLHENSRKARRK